MQKSLNANISLDVVDFELLAKCIDAIGTSTFPGLLCDFASQICSADSVFLSAFFRHEKPAALYTNHSAEKIQDALKIYTEVAYLLDPFYQHYRDIQSDKVLQLRELAPDNFERTEYYQLFYKAMGLIDECGLLIHINKDAALFFSFGSHVKGHRTKSTYLATAMPLLGSMTRRHWTVLNPERTDGSGRLAAHLELAFANFGTSILSPRESEIVRMILRGHSSKSIARIFDNSPETIKVHRKRIYSKLEIVSQGNLLSLFISALTSMPATSKEDPLVHYYSNR